MEFFSDVVMLSRFQFAMVIFFHFLFVPLSIGLGLIVAIMETRYYKSGSEEDASSSQFWLKLFTTTFAIGVATGITMEFSFGTNWADYSRFVGDIFGAPLAAEGLFAFFLESVFLGILLFGRKKVSRKFYLVSSWLVWFGACLSALWIIIANSWMQTPAGYEVIQTPAGSKAILTDFWAAVSNPSTLPCYLHTVDALVSVGGFAAMALGAFYLLRNRHVSQAKTFISVGFGVALVSSILMGPLGHYQAVEVSQNQPSKLAAMEGQYETEPVGLALFGWVDEENETTHALSIPGATSFLASGSFNTEYPGLNDFPEGDTPKLVNLVFQGYHMMIICFGVMVLGLILAFLQKKGKMGDKKWGLRILEFAWIAPFLAIQTGWLTAEVGRQPWIVWGELRTEDAISLSVSSTDLLLTILLFFAIYLFIFIAWFRLIKRFVKQGPSPLTENIFKSDSVVVTDQVELVEEVSVTVKDGD